MKFYFFGILSALSLLLPITAQAECASGNDKLCVMEETLKTAPTIDNPSWRDKVYRELAKSFTFEGYEGKGIALIEKIENPDTKAMTIRGIGMAAADAKWPEKARYDALFRNLTAAAQKIEHPPSYAIALTYIAMAQAFAGDDAGASTTAKGMKNDALRHKAFGETAEIQAERNDFKAAMASIADIDSLSYRNKAYTNVAGIFVKNGKLNEAYACAQKIDNAYLKAQVLQTIINYGNDEEMLSVREDRH